MTMGEPGLQVQQQQPVFHVQVLGLVHPIGFGGPPVGTHGGGVGGGGGVGVGWGSSQAPVLEFQ